MLHLFSRPSAHFPARLGNVATLGAHMPRICLATSPRHGLFRRRLAGRLLSFFDKLKRPPTYQARKPLIADKTNDKSPSRAKFRIGLGRY